VKGVANSISSNAAPLVRIDMITNHSNGGDLSMIL
jgi:hypothetical protein